MPKSCLKVLSILANFNAKGISQSEIISHSNLSKRTVKYALKRLEQERLAIEIINCRDIRRRLYFCEAK